MITRSADKKRGYANYTRFREAKRNSSLLNKIVGVRNSFDFYKFESKVEVASFQLWHDAKRLAISVSIVHASLAQLSFSLSLAGKQSGRQKGQGAGCMRALRRACQAAAGTDR